MSRIPLFIKKGKKLNNWGTVNMRRKKENRILEAYFQKKKGF